MAPIKSSLARSVGKLFGVSKDTDSSLRGATQSLRTVAAPFSATGGNIADGITPGDGYTYHTFSTSGSLVVSGTGTVDILVVAGGGGGGGRAGGGGGAGGVVEVVNAPLTGGSYSISVGSGGAGAGQGQRL